LAGIPDHVTPQWLSPMSGYWFHLLQPMPRRRYCRPPRPPLHGHSGRPSANRGPTDRSNVGQIPLLRVRISFQQLPIRARRIARPPDQLGRAFTLLNRATVDADRRVDHVSSFEPRQKKLCLGNAFSRVSFSGNQAPPKKKMLKHFTHPKNLLIRFATAW